MTENSVRAVDSLTAYLRAASPDAMQDILSRVIEAAGTAAWREAVEAQAEAHMHHPDLEFEHISDLKGRAWQSVADTFDIAVATRARQVTASGDYDALATWQSVTVGIDSPRDGLEGTGLLAEDVRRTRRDLRVAFIVTAQWVVQRAVEYAVSAVLLRDELTLAEYTVLADVLTPAWYNAWRQRYEAGDTQPDADRLLLNGWQPVDGMPRWLSDPVAVRCIRCGAERDLLPRDLALAGKAVPTCQHPAGAPPLTIAQRREISAVRKARQDEKYEQEAREAGWEPVDPRPARETTPWKLRCPTCGETVLARVSKSEHMTPCPHRPTDAEQAAMQRFAAAGWETLGHPLRGGTSKRYPIRCMTCGFETSREAIRKIRPCTHPGHPEGQA
ncbi:hypothetical protein AB0K09_03385 [Streptomyces sp. NPDC049577]|uniref:hypothetical protein n=1 Tax=Streptomyces sp. NPDC049577 TaxID=3155153 RepID=UPI0034194350